MNSVTQRHDNNNGDGAMGDSSPFGNDDGRLCIVCDREISAARLKAMPTTNKFVQCVMDSGDVPVLKRHDQLIGTLENGEVASTYYKGEPNPYLAKAIAEHRTLSKMGRPGKPPVKFAYPGPGHAMVQLDAAMYAEMNKN